MAAPASNAAPEVQEQASLILRAEPVLRHLVTLTPEGPNLCNFPLCRWAAQHQLPLSGRRTAGPAQAGREGGAEMGPVPTDLSLSCRAFS